MHVRDMQSRRVGSSQLVFKTTEHGITQNGLIERPCTI